ncbi:MAG: endolytic transglycosylase MltG [Candidatus Sungbacteria bacterium]|nr:endolytic transglycosylase MltG [Candidatus Sungbacteria bacterium]
MENALNTNPPERKLRPRRAVFIPTPSRISRGPATGMNGGFKFSARGSIPHWKVWGFILCGALVLILAWLAYEIYLPHTLFYGQRELEIPAGFGSRKIGGLLKDRGFINSKWAFVVYTALKNKASDLKPGAYMFSENTTIYEITRDLVAGENREVVLTIPEGWNLKDIGNYLEREGVAKADDFWRAAGYPAKDYTGAKTSSLPLDFSNKFTFLKLKPKTVGLEGFLFPDTYRVFRDASVEDIIQKMLANFGEKAALPYQDEITRQKKSLFDVITVASLIEEEVKSDEDRAIVAGILWKRLDAGIPLQVDATLVYIRGRNTTPLTSADKSANSSFNTYKYRGLPKGPISNPGLASIRAALNPKTSPYLYYLSAPDGRTVFSKTLEEHNTAKAKYLH